MATPDRGQRFTHFNQNFAPEVLVVAPQQWSGAPAQSGLTLTLCCAKLRRVVRLGECVRSLGADGWRRAYVDFVTGHDGVTIADLVSYHPSWNCGVEGPTGDPTITPP
jgi:hypothetical protein